MPAAHYMRKAYEIAAATLNRPAVWSGFLGGELTGSHVALHQDIKDESRARERFRQSQQKASQNKLFDTPASAGSQEEVAYGYPPTSTVGGCFVNESAFLDFAVRQYSCVSKIIFGGQWNGWHANQGVNCSGFRVVTPFAESPWAFYWLNAPKNKLIGQSLYIEMARNRFPELMALPSKYSWRLYERNKLGRRVRQLQHNVRNKIHSKIPSFSVRSGLMDNWLDFQEAFRFRDDFNTIMERSIMKIKEYKETSHIKSQRLLDEHRMGYADHSNELQVLMGLAVNLDVN